ncbi:MAG TPA: hypothetical protein VF641_03545 [Methylobacterium sp.]|jgi:hypothetical protein
MPVESWIDPDETAALAAAAMSQIDAVLDRLTALERDAFWSSVRKCYNTPYNDPQPRSSEPAVAAPAPEVEVPMAAIPLPAAFAPDAHAV